MQRQKVHGLRRAKPEKSLVARLYRGANDHWAAKFLLPGPYVQGMQALPKTPGLLRAHQHIEGSGLRVNYRRRCNAHLGIKKRTMDVLEWYCGDLLRRVA